MRESPALAGRWQHVAGNTGGNTVATRAKAWYFAAAG